jgi:o-succinylbenzoate synthase
MRSPVITHRAVLRERQGFRVALREAGSLEGFGEALPLEAAGTESQAETETALGRLSSAFKGRSGGPSDFLDLIEEAAPGAPAARCAFDGAVHDLEGQLRGLSVARLLGAERPLAIPVNTVIGCQESEQTVRLARAAVARGFRTLKLKVGEGSSDADEARLRAVRRALDALGSDLRLRIDANGAWSAPEAIEILNRLAPLEIELVEQPVPARDLEGLARVHAESPIPVAADEALALEAGRRAAIEGRIASIVVLKPMVLGGLRPCVRLAAAVRARALRCLVTTTFEGGIGTALAAHLAAATAERDLACGLDSHGSLEAELPPELIPRDGWLRVLDGPGLGWKPAA